MRISRPEPDELHILPCPDGLRHWVTDDDRTKLGTVYLLRNGTYAIARGSQPDETGFHDPTTAGAYLRRLADKGLL